MAQPAGDLPWGLKFINWIGMKWWPHRRLNKLSWHRGGVLVLTYFAYMCYHMSRKPISVVKNVLNINCTGLKPPPDIPNNDTNWCDWAPFDTPDAPALLGALDSAFLFAYAAAMFLSGFVAERVNLRYFLSLGMLFSGIACYAFGLAKVYNIHSLWYYIFVQAAGGVFQTSGWPGVVTIVGNWFGKGKRGLIFGIWNSHTSLGNILGSLIAGEYVETNWGYSFIIPGVLMGLAGFVIFLFLAPHPEDVGCTSPNSSTFRRKIYSAETADEESSGEDSETRPINHEDRVTHRPKWYQHDNIPDTQISRSETSPMLSVNRRWQSSSNERAIGFVGAIQIPGVVEYSLSLFFSKLVSYTFLYWLPLYISYATTYSPTKSADLSTLFDVGGIVGAIAAGVFSDYSGMSAVTCAWMLTVAVPMLSIYDFFGSVNFTGNVVLLFIVGIFVNGPYALITTAVSAELGTHPSLGEDSKALATVTAIIDGTGSIGAAVGPLLAGFVSHWMGWHSVFYMLMIADAFALLFLTRLVYRDLQTFRQRRLAV